MPLVINENKEQPRTDKELGESLSHKQPKGNLNWKTFSGEMIIRRLQKRSICIYTPFGL